MSGKKRKVVVLPCSGIGKTLGTVGRDVMYELVDNLRPDVTATTCLPLLMIEDPCAKRMVTENPAITIDGCPLGCALKCVQSIGVTPSRGYKAIDFCKNHRDLKPEGIVELNDAGNKLVVLAAQELAKEIDKIMGEENA